MFEVGKRYKTIENYGFLKKGNVYTIENISENNTVLLKEIGGWWNFTRFDSTPIDDTQAPRMVTTCDIGARVVRGRDWGYSIDVSQGGENAIGTIIESATGNNCWVLWDNGIKHIYRIGEYGKFFDLYYAEEQPKKEVAQQYICALPETEVCKSCNVNPDTVFCEGCVEFSKRKNLKTDKENGKGKISPDPAPGIASVMFGSKPRLMFGSLMQIQGPTKDEQARNQRTEEERKRYDKR